MRRITVPNRATYSPVALTDLILAAPLVSRVFLGATLPGRMLQAAAVGVYAGSSLKDWLARRHAIRIDFATAFGADVFDLEIQPEEERRRELLRLSAALNDGWIERRVPRPELARLVDHYLTTYIASITGQRIETSVEVRGWSMTQLVFPFAYGACDVVSGDVAIFKDLGILEPHVLAHEFAHRKGYWKELHAQVLAYLALRGSGEPVLVQAARAERLHRQLRVLAPDDPDAYDRILRKLPLRTELHRMLRALRQTPGAYEAAVTKVMRPIYRERMRLTGQNGITDYDEGFTNFLWTFGRSSRASQDTRLAREI